MLQVGKIKIRNIKELQNSDVATPNNTLTPLKKRKKLKPVSTIKNLKEDDRHNEAANFSNIANTTTKTATKRLLKSALKETPSNQKRIDSYFTSCPKTYEIKVPKEQQLSFVKSETHKIKAKGSRKPSANKKDTHSPERPKPRRKRLFTDSTEPSAENMPETSVRKVHKNNNSFECITIVTDSEEENDVKKESFSSKGTTGEKIDDAKPALNSNENQVSTPNGYKVPSIISSSTTASSLSFGQQLSTTSCEITKSIEKSSVSGHVKRKPKPCPSYKIIENTTFAVDAFQFGYIDKVTHYFLTHFHADHYIGLTKSFSMPLFVSPITARLLRAFIPVQEQYIHEIEPNQTVAINNIEITALDANHCPGSIMFVFKFLDTGKCVLHTGDFRACHDMESEQIFWNNHIHTIYLDTTYISDKYAFCTQYESIEKAHYLIDKFLEKNCWHRILYICGSYIIGKEKFWSSLAEEFNLKVWAEGNRKKALKAIDDERFNRLLVEDPKDASMHILPMGKLTYLELVEYFKQYEHQYDALFALRPSGWEKDTKPRYGSKINLVGVEYSEHSSYAEMQRFVKFLKPDQVISTVPIGKNLAETSNVPTSWYKYDTLKVTSNYQPTIDSFLGKTPLRKTSIRPPNINKGGVEHFVSPLQLRTPKKNHIVKNSTQTDEVFSIKSSEPAKVNENIEEVCTNVQKANLPTKSKKTTIAKSITNSSEEFEKTDVIIKTKKNFKVKDHNKLLTKHKSNKKQLTPKNNSGLEDKINTEELQQTPDIKQRRTTSRLQKEILQLNISLEKELNNLNNPSTQNRITTRSQDSSNKVTNKLSKSKTSQYSKAFESTARKKSKTKSIGSTSNDNTAHFEPEFPVSQKRLTRLTATSTKSSTLLKAQENEFESKVLKISEQNTSKTISSPKSHSKSAINFNANQPNPILKSISNSSLDRLSHDALPLNKINSSTISEKLLHDFENLPTKSSKNKRLALNCNLPAFKKCKTTFNAQTILNTILEQVEDLDHLNCSQLAGLVVDTVNQQNPDDNKDHIPADLLSDADDDWM